MENKWTEEIRLGLKDFMIKVERGEMTAERAFEKFMVQFKGSYMYITKTPYNFKPKIIELIKLGYNDKQIAYKLGCTSPAVRSVRRRQ